MSDVLNGLIANVTTPLVATVAGTGAGVGGAVRITTSAPHLFGPSDYVTGSGIGGTTEANVSTTVNIIDSTQFDMVGTTFVNAWTSGGIVTDNALSPQIQWPSDGDPGSSQLSALLSGGQAICDRTQFLQKEVYLLEHALRPRAIANTGATSAPGASSVFFAAGAWIGQTSFNTANAQPLTALALLSASCIVELEFSSTMELLCTGASGIEAWIELNYQIDSGSITSLPFARAVTTLNSSGTASQFAPVTLRGIVTIPSGHTTLNVNVNGACPTATGSPSAFDCYGAWQLTSRIWYNS
jgi:hypothetical protein